MEKHLRKEAFIKLDKKKISYIACFLLGVQILFLPGFEGTTQAQEYPARPITLLISYAPGAGMDVFGRILAQGATKSLGQEFIPVNKPGGGGAVAAGILVGSKGDGYTILTVSSSTFTSAPHLESVPYDPHKDFVPIIQFGALNTGMIVRSDSPHKSLKELIAFSRTNPGKVSYGIPGVGTAPHLAMEYIMDVEKVNIAVIPFAGGGPAATALLGGHVTSSGVSTSGFLSHLKAGKVQALATFAGKRLKLTPEVPTLVELGYPYGAFEEIYLMVAPKGTPPAIVKKLEDAFRKAMETPEFRTTAESFNSYEANPLSGQELKKYIEDRYTREGEIIRKAKLGKQN